MNKQVKTTKGGAISRGIEWTDYTINPIGGCFHGCRWKMADGTWVICYADSTAQVMTGAYPHGFEHHYWRPHVLKEPAKVKTPSKVFIDSMSDMMGHWVPEEQIKAVFDMCREAHWHTFQLLTKNAPRLLKFDLPKNVAAGVSAPPTFMFGKELSKTQQRDMVFTQLRVLQELKDRGHAVCWMSIEPLSFDITDVFNVWTSDDSMLPLDWAVIGAGSSGSKHYQPHRDDVQRAHTALRRSGAKIFHKGNLIWTPHLEEFPDCFAGESAVLKSTNQKTDTARVSGSGNLLL